MSAITNFLDIYCEEVDYKSFYRDVFPVGSFEEKGVYEDGKYNGIIVEVTKDRAKNGKVKVMRHTVTDELDKLDEVAGRDNFCLMSPISYAGKSRKTENARYLYAIAIDVDGIKTKDDRGLDVMFHQIENVEYLPAPTYIVASGTGIHVYYVLKDPIPLFENILVELEKLKRRLTWQFWTQGVTNLAENVQYEPVCQGFRMPGTVTKAGERAKVYIYGRGEKVDIDYLNSFVPAEYRTKPLVYKSNLTLKDAAKKYPEWYQNRIIDKKPRGTWTCKPDLYHWWIRKIKEGAVEGHRYWCVMTLATYAKKCAIPLDQLEEDAFGLLDLLNERGKQPFTEDDIIHALESYNDSYITYPIDTIVNRTGISIEKNKRNYQKQVDHLEEARAIRDIRMKRKGKKWTDGNGRKSSKDSVKEWQAANPGKKKADCIRETGLSKPTVYKWWNEIK